jgi:hypothetical protein
VDKVVIAIVLVAQNADAMVLAGMSAAVCGFREYASVSPNSIVTENRDVPIERLKALSIAIFPK